MLLRCVRLKADSRAPLGATARTKNPNLRNFSSKFKRDLYKMILAGSFSLGRNTGASLFE
jgi:hypothetical protein